MLSTSHPEYLNLYEFEVLEAILRDLDHDSELKPSEKEILEKISRIIKYIRSSRKARVRVVTKD